MKKLLLFLPVIFVCSILPACARDAHAPIKVQKCTSTPCSNTETGEDPQEQHIREGSEQSDKIREGGDDQRRWSSIVLYSDSTKPAKLTMPVIRSLGFDMRLEPKLGQLSFSKQGVVQTFKIASAAADKSSVCPEYAVQVTEASPIHALVSLTCYQYEYAPNRYHMGIDYYLYDAETAVMRNIWNSAVSDKNARTPEPKPIPSIKIVANGYRFDWSGIQPSNAKPSRTTLHNSYIRSTSKNGDKVLLCTNLSAPKGGGVEDEMCEGGILPRIPEKGGK